MEGQIELLDYLDSLESRGFDILDYIPIRLKNIGWSLKAARTTLRNCGEDWREGDEQQEQGSQRRA